MKTHTHAHGRRRSPGGFTLIEILVSVVIMLVLAVLIFALTGRARESAAKAQTVEQMRQIGAAVAMWASENNNGEPMYFANGTGDFGEEGALTGKKPAISPGNPAKLLYFKEDVEGSYLGKHDVFFSPLTRLEVPSFGDYDPNRASAKSPWGTYVWLYPSDTRITAKQLAAMAGFSNTRISREARNKVIMANDYRGVYQPRFNPHYHALFKDGSVRHIADSAERWTEWLRGESS